jgi:hypothetical protein
MLDFERSHFTHTVRGMLSRVLDDAWRDLDPHVRGGKLTREQVAQRIMQSALLGERDPSRLKDDAMKVVAGYGWL